MVINERYLDRSSHSIKEYLKEIKKIPLLEAGEELRLATLSMNGDEAARETLINANLRFVITVAKQHQRDNIKIEDLINEGNCGLIEAVNRYDPNKGAKLISYAVHYITRNIREFIKGNQDIYDIPKSKVGKIYKMKNAISNLEGELGRSVYPEDLYGEVDMSDNEVDIVYGLVNYRSVSTSQSIGTEENFTLGDTLSSSSYDDTIRDEENSFNVDLVSNLVDKLPFRLKRLMIEYYGLGGEEALGKEGYATKHELTLNRVSQLHKEALRHLKRIVKGESVISETKEPTTRDVIERIREAREGRKEIIEETANVISEGVVTEDVPDDIVVEVEDTTVVSKIKWLFKKIF